MPARVDPSGACPACGRPTYGGAAHCKARRCPHYAPIWARDQQRKLFENLGAYAGGEGHAVMITVTAPGRSELPWDEARCAPLGEHKHDGRLGCRVQPERAEEWNKSASDRWRRMHDRAARLTVQEDGAQRPRLLTRAFEQQRRGVLHVHAVVGRATPGEKVSAACYAERLRQLAPSYGFGMVDVPAARAWHAREAAAYISSYLSTGKGAKRTLGETVMSDQLPRSVIHVDTVLTLETGVTMRALRLRRLLKVKWDVELPFPEQRAIAEMLAVFPGAELVRGP